MLSTSDLIAESAQGAQLLEKLPRWLREVPLYRHYPAGLPESPAVLTELPSLDLPFITKREIRRGFPRNFLRDGVALDGLLDEELVELESTSGTDEDRTPLLLARGWWAEQEARALRHNRLVAGVLDETPDARRVTISSPVCNSEVCFTGVPTRADRIVGHTLFASLSRHPFLWGEHDLERIAQETLEWQPQFLDVDPVYGVAFARFCERHHIKIPSLRFIVASYEFVSVVHRRLLERAFGVPVFNLYGSTETGHLLMEGERGEMRPSYETAFLEVIEPDASGVGELVVTTLTNDFMPLIRYRIDDLVERREHPYRTTYVVHGRVRDAVSLADGRCATVWQVDQCFADMSGIAHYQLRQSPSGEWGLWIVPEAPAPAPEALSGLKARLEAVLEAPGRVTIQTTDVLLPESSGKFRLVCPRTTPGGAT